MNKKALIIGLCGILTVGLYYFNHSKPRVLNFKPTIEMSKSYNSTRAEQFNTLEDYMNEFDKRVVHESESTNLRNQTINTCTGGNEYNSQKSEAYLNSTFYLGDGFSTFAPQPKLPEVKNIN